MSFIATVQNFARIPVQARTLYVIDVDETVLYFREVPPSYWDGEKSTDEALQAWKGIVRSCEPVPTDPIFLPAFLEQVVHLGSCVLFVTARDFDLSETTRAQLSKVGVNVPFGLVCTSGDRKGSLIKWLWKKYASRCDHIVFIDDLILNIEDVQHELPDAAVFLFNRH